MDPTTAPFDFLVLATMGFTISLGHCVGMCGPLVTAFSVSQKSIARKTSPLWLRLLLYHGGRVFSYMLLGSAMGLVGSTIYLAGEGRRIQGILSIGVAILMLLLGLGLLGWLPTERWVEGGLWQRWIGPRLRGLLAARTTPRIWLLGMANGFLPCGPVLAALMTAAATASPAKGLVTMLAFGAGTVPVLWILGMGTGQLSVRLRVFFNRVGAVMVLLIAAQLLLRGLAAWELVAHLRFGEVVIY